MSWEIVISALSLGAVSSFHCVGMCGAIAFSLPTNYLSPTKKLAGILLYNIGRVSVYSLLGLIFGIIGRQINLGGFQKAFSITAGVVMLVIVLQGLLQKRVLHFKAFDKLNYSIQSYIARYIKKKQVYGMFLLGMANGLLPCGMIYLAVTGALATGSITGGTLFMASYGLGTIPAMFLLSYFGFVINISTRNLFKKAAPYVMVTMAVLLILRGMDLGIPYVSPASNHSPGHAVSCH